MSDKGKNSYIYIVNNKKKDEAIEKIEKIDSKLNLSTAADSISNNEKSNNDKYSPIEEARYDVKGLNTRSEKNTQLYEKYIDYYEKKCNQNLELKKKFFRNFMTFLTMIIVIIPAAILVMAFVKNSIGNTEVICAVSGSAATIVTSIIIIPKIIAKYLFSTEEDAIISDLLKEIQTHDIETRKNYTEK